MNRRARLASAAMLAVLAVVLAACASSAASGQRSGTYQGVGLEPPQPRPSFTLSDTDGKAFHFGRRTAGHPTLLFFGYTECPDICPTTMANINQALATLPASVQQDFYVVFASTDVKHDTGKIIKDWLANFTGGVSATFVGLRGTQAQVDAAQTAAHIPLAEDGGRTHSTQVLFFGADDYARVTWLQSDRQVAQMSHDLAVATKSS